jgi:cytochrome b561
MRLRNDADRYGAATKLFHWVTVLLLAAQFTVGYTMRGDDHSGRGRDGGGDDSSGPGGGESGAAVALMRAAVARADGRNSGSGGGGFGSSNERLLEVHVLLGIAILALATLRLWWRLSGSLPAWAPQLTPFERRLQTLLERCLYSLLFLIPLSGLALVLASGEDVHLFGTEWKSSLEVMGDDSLLTAHIATHIAFFVVAGLHIGLVLKHQLVNRDRLINRML